MPASFTLRKTDVSQVMRELRAIDKDLIKEMRAEFRREIRPTANELKANIPGPSPLSGMSRGVRIARTRRPADERSPFVWKKPGASIDIGGRSKGMRRGRYRTEPVIRIRFTDKRPYSAFSILETARQGSNFRGRNMISGINGKAPPNGKGRWVIQQFYDKQPQLISSARMILRKYAAKVSKRMARRF